MNDMAKYLIGIIIGIIVVGAIVMIFMNPGSDSTNTTDNASFTDAVQEQVNSIGNNATNTNNGNGQSASSSQGSQGSNIIGGGVEENGQAGGGQFYQINYSDGNFRQYDTQTGKLIGSTFDEDQAQLSG